MNNKNINTQVYAQKVELLLRLMPIIMDEGVFAVHGGTAINLFLKDLPRYSVDIDLTYIPLSDRLTAPCSLVHLCEKIIRREWVREKAVFMSGNSPNSPM